LSDSFLKYPSGYQLFAWSEELSKPSPNSKAGFQGMTVHWIAVTEGRWKLKAAVVGFKVLSGGHNRNIRRVCLTALG